MSKRFAAAFAVSIISIGCIGTTAWYIHNRREFEKQRSKKIKQQLSVKHNLLRRLRKWFDLGYRCYFLKDSGNVFIIQVNPQCGMFAKQIFLDHFDRAQACPISWRGTQIMFDALVDTYFSTVEKTRFKELWEDLNAGISNLATNQVHYCRAYREIHNFLSRMGHELSNEIDKA